MNQKTIDILNDQQLLSLRDRYYSRLTEIYSGKLQQEPLHTWGIYGGSNTDVFSEPERWLEEALESLAGKAAMHQAAMLQDEKVFRPLCIHPTLGGVHFVDYLLGADVFCNEESKQWYCRHLKTPVGELGMPDLEKNAWWNVLKRLLKAFKDSRVKLPVFGIPTPSSALNAVVNLYSEEILIKMLEEPEKAKTDLEVINRVIAAVHRLCLDYIPLEQLSAGSPVSRIKPPGYGHVDGCTTQLLSADLYKDFIADLDDALLSIYPHGGMIHICGSHTQHIPVWREMKRLRILQLNDRAAEDLAIYFDKLRDDQIFYVSPCEGMPMEKIMKITGGRRVIIQKEP